MEPALFVSTNIKIPQTSAELIKKTQKRLSNYIVDKRNYDHNPHLSVGTKIIPKSQIPLYVNVLTKELRNLSKFKIKFSRVKPTINRRYIFLYPDIESTKHLKEIHKIIFSTTKNIGKESFDGGSEKYPFEPHITITKLKPNQVSVAMDMIGQSLEEIEFVVDGFEVSKEERHEDSYVNFPVIERICLS